MFSSLSWGQSQFDDAVEKATSELRLVEEDIALNLEICDQIRSKAVSPKDAARALRRRLAHRNPNVQLLALTLTDVCVKNGGDHFLVEIAGKEFMDNMTSLLQAPNVNIEVRSRILRLIQNWAVAFEGKPVLGYVNQVYKDLSNRGFSFPPKDPVIANSAMVDTSTAPEWIDSDVCLRCRTPFSFTNRKHHCRNCGQVFDQQCSSRSMALPHFGITQEVRVCDSCHTKLTARRERKERSQSADFHTEHRRRHGHHSRDVVDADLQRAIQLSLAEENGSRSKTYRSLPTWHTSEPPLVDRSLRPNNDTTINDDQDDPELRAAIEASLREARAPRPSAPAAEPDPIHSAPPLPVLPNHDLLPREEDAILTFSQTVQDEPGTARRNLARVHALYDQASGLRPKLALSLDDVGRKEQLLGEMHEKLSHAVKLYDQLLTDQLARPVWQRNNAPSRAGTWHAGSHGVNSLGYNRAEQRAQGEVAQYPPQSYQQHQYETLQRQHTQPDQSRRLETQQQSSQVSQQQQDPPLAYQQLEPLQSYQQQQYQPEPSQTYLAPQHQQQETSHSFQSRSYEIQQQQLQQQPEPAQPYDQRAQPYSQQTQTLVTSSPYSNRAWGSRSAPYEQQSLTSAQRPLTPTLTPEQHLPPQFGSPPLVPQHTTPMTVQYIGSAQPIVQSQLAAPQFQPVQSPAPPPLPPQSQSLPAAQQQSAYQPMHSPQSTPLASHSVHPSPPAQITYQPMHSPPYTQARQMPMFPTAPTSNPQAFPLYGPGPPSGLEQTKKEVALIDL